MNAVEEKYRAETSDLIRRAFATGKAQVGSVKCAITACSKALGINWHRARDLLRMKITPKPWEIDRLRELDGLTLVPAEQLAPEPKADLMQTLLSELRELKDDCKAFIDRRRAKREKAKSIRHSEREELYRALNGDRA